MGKRPTKEGHRTIYLNVEHRSENVMFSTGESVCEDHWDARKLKERVGEKAILLKIDVDKTPLAASAYNIQAVPTLILFRNGEIKWRHAGVAPAQYLEQIINQNL